MVFRKCRHLHERETCDIEFFLCCLVLLTDLHPGSLTALLINNFENLHIRLIRVCIRNVGAIFRNRQGVAQLSTDQTSMFLGKILIIYVPGTHSAPYKHVCCTCIQLYKNTVH